MPETSYSYDQFMRDFERDPAVGVTELATRRAAFDKNMRSILAQNEAYRAGRSTWCAAVNNFADRTPAEMAMLRGHRRGLAQRLRAQPLRRPSSQPRVPPTEVVLIRS